MHAPTQRADGPAWAPEPGADAAFVQFPKDRRLVVDDGTPIAYTIVGPDEAVPGKTPFLFANGWGCSDVYWVGIVPPLAAAGHPCIVVDPRGLGASGLPRRPNRGARNIATEDLSIKRHAADLVEVLRDTGLGRAVVVGHSMGVQVALETYRLAPTEVQGLVLVAGPYENPLRTFYGLPLLDLAYPVTRTVMATVPEVAIPLWSIVGNRTAGYLGARLGRAIGPKTRPEQLHPYLLHLAASDPAVLVRSVDAMRTHSAADLLGRIEVPVLILAAGSDTFAPPRCSRTMFERIPTSEIHWFDDAGHTLPIEEPEAIVALTTEWHDRRITGSATAP